MPTCTAQFGNIWIRFNHDIEYLLTITNIGAYVIAAGENIAYQSALHNWLDGRNYVAQENKGIKNLMIVSINFNKVTPGISINYKD